MYITFKPPAVSTLLLHWQIIMWGTKWRSISRIITYMNRISFGKLQIILLLIRWYTQWWLCFCGTCV